MNEKCTRCGSEQPKERMLARRVQFVEIGKGGSTRKSRTTDWLCSSCVAADPDWQRPSYQASPGQVVHAE